METTSYVTPKNILISQDSYLFSMGVRVTNTDLLADLNGKKIIKAGTPIGGSTNVLEKQTNSTS